ncbi:MAG: HAD-IA family hydrolase [Burkholderiales bacterium]|nr:HAD-IA family hydrolase [Burkholderiales bacterium]
MLQVLLWDVDGTLAETERDGHRVAFNRAFEAFGLPWRWDEVRYGELLRVTGGRERLLADMAARADAPVLADEREALARELHRLKNGFYAELVYGGGIPLRDGVRELIEAAAARGLRQGIVTTTSRVNVDALLARHLGAGWGDRFAVVVCGEDVAAKKPAPECYRRALAALRLEPLAALAIEDSCSGTTAARGADVPVIVTRSAYFAEDIVDQAVAIGPGLHTRRGWQPAPAPRADAAVTVDDLVDWHARMEWVGAHG